MTGPDPAVARIRVAVRHALAASAGPGVRVLVACSGGADSLALAAATAFEAPRQGVLAGAVTVDHGLQEGSADTARQVRERLLGLGLDPVLVERVRVEGGGGPEAAARRARYGALAAAAARTGSRWVLLGHTRDDQAETVLLGLGRGSGPRSIAGMSPVDPPWLRPLLDLPRADTEAACRAEALPVWADPHNADPRFTRSRLRHEVLPLLEDVLGGGVAAALARTAAMVREDLAALDARAERVLRDRLGPARRAGEEAAEEAAEEAGGEAAAEVSVFLDQPPAVRRRMVRRWLLVHGVSGLTSAHVTAVDGLLTCWHGQGPAALPGGRVVERSGGRLRLRPGPGQPGMVSTPEPA